MLSTGNDIVALNAIDVTRTKQPNFYSKILTPAEVALHTNPSFAAIPFEVFVWLLWSIKESAFKFLQRLDTGILFTPVKFEVSDIYVPEDLIIDEFSLKGLVGNGPSFDLLSPITSILTFENKILYSNSLIYKDLIFTVINCDRDFDNVNWGVKEIDSSDNETQSAEIRAFLIDNFYDKDIVITKDSRGIPNIQLVDETTIPVSFSHHENWVAYSWQS